MTLFIGIDLAWKSDKNPSAAVVLSGDMGGVSLVEASDGLKTLSDVEGFVDRHSDSDTVIAVDAPLIITKLDGQRPCEKLITERFGAAHAGAHSSNLRQYPSASSVQLAQDLVARGFCHCPQPHTPALRGRWFFEVYPHPAHVILFGRTKIIKYKKGKSGEIRGNQGHIPISLKNRKMSPLSMLLSAFLTFLRRGWRGEEGSGVEGSYLSF